MFNIMEQQYLFRGQYFDNLESAFHIQALLKTLTFLAFRRKTFKTHIPFALFRTYLPVKKVMPCFYQFRIPFPLRWRLQVLYFVKFGLVVVEKI